MTKTFLSSILTLALVAPVFSQAQDKQQEEKIVIGTTEVMLDVVVRDKKGRPVKDLKASDFEVYEDGVKQQIESFRLVLRETSSSGDSGKKGEVKTGEAPARPLSMSELNIVAMVFDRLSPNARNLAQKAALSYINERNSPDDFTGVFLIDLSLHTLQSYTEDQKLIRDAIDRATTRATGTYASSGERVRNLSERSAALEQSSANAASAANQAGAGQNSAGAGAAGAQSGLAAAEQMLAEINARMLESFEALERDQQGYATTNSLHAVVDSLRNLPGRKTMIFFSEGLSIPPNVVRLFRGVISAANRANVAIYTVDAAGLRIESADAESRREINSLANRRARQAATGRDDASGPLTKSLERNEDLLRLNPHSGLGDLAGETGGLLIANTNDLVTGLRRVDEDMRAHYELTYSPRNTDYDGKFRQISVKLARSNLDVQTRKGYFALNAQMSSPVLEYEAPALAAITGGHSADSFPVRAAGFNFPEANVPGLLPVLVEVPADAFTFFSDKDKKAYNTDFSIVVLIKDKSHQIVRKLSQNYQLSGPLDKIDMAKRGEILFYRETRLPPGIYSIEAVAYDAPSGKSGLKTSSVEVPDAAQSQLRLSSVALVKRGERISANGQQGSNPFQFGEALLYPNMGEPLSKSTSKQLTFFFTAYTQKGSTDKVNLTIEILKDGKSMGQTSGELPASDSEGRIQYANALPLDGFQPGAYELKITVKNSRSSASRTTKFAVAP